jgi:tRNA (cmo5U34)-methyltransferase
MKNRFEVIRQHFEKEAILFDKFFFKVAPHYEKMMSALIDALPFKKQDRLKVLDLGCGTGNLSKKIISAYPNAMITCVDMAENMLKMARAKLKDNNNIKFWLGDIRDFDYSEKYDAIVASLVLHHVERRDKLRFYRKIQNALSKKGIFLCMDIFLSSNMHLQKLHMDKWKEFMRRNALPIKKINDMIRRHHREDRPVVFEDELNIMRKAGFKQVEVIMKQYNFALYGGGK